MSRKENVCRMLKSRNACTGVRVNKSRAQRPNFRLGKRQIMVTCVLLLIFMGSGIGYVWSNFESTQIGYNLTELRQERMRLQELNRKLKLERATLRSPQYLETLAVEKLGLRRPSPEQIVFMP